MGDSKEDLIKRAAAYVVAGRHVIALTGAGVSTESGIPDFRGPSGVWTKNPEAERRAYRGYDRFLQDPKAWWQERLAAPVGMLGNLDQAQPNPSHVSLAELEKMGLLKCIITQNVDGLHTRAGSQRVLEYHGCFHKLRCISCCARFPRDEFDLEALQLEDRLPPRCPSCGGTVKSDTVSFGEPIPSDVAHQSLVETWQCDVMLICGTSAVVYPFAGLPRTAREKKVEKQRKTPSGLVAAESVPAVTIIEINADPTPLTEDGVSDYFIQGRTGEVLPALVAEVKRLARRH